MQYWQRLKRFSCFIILIVNYLNKSIIGISCSIQWSAYLTKNRTSLVAYRKQIENLNGLEKFNQLAEINLSINRISDLSLFSQSNFSVNKLILSINLIRNVQPLGHLINLQYLDISRNHIESVESLTMLTGLKTLRIELNNIKTIDTILNKMSTLTLLDATRNLIDHIHIDKNTRATELKKLILSSNLIDNVKQIGHLTGLVYLDLSINKLSKLDGSIGDMKNLSSLYLMDNKIKNIDILAKMQNLENLHVSNNLVENVCALKDSLSHELSVIDFDGNHIENIDCILTRKHQKLFQLSFKNNKIKSINLINTNKLSDIHLSGNKQLNEINLNLSESDMQNIDTLNMSNLNLTNLNFLSNLVNITSIDLSNNNLINISMLENLKKLKVLNLDNNKIDDINCLKHVNNVYKLSIKNNKIKHLNNYMGHFKSLNYLRVDQNLLEDLSVIDNFKHLNTLTASNNQIKLMQLSNSLEKIEHVDLSRNKLKSFDLERVSNVKSLNISHNEIKMELKLSTLDKLTRLASIDLSFNKKIFFKHNPFVHYSDSFFLSDKLEYIYIDFELVALFQGVKRNLIEKKGKFNYVFVKSLNIITNNDLNYGSCSLKLEFLKLNIHLNVYFNTQIEKFLNECSLIEWDMDF